MSIQRPTTNNVDALAQQPPTKRKPIFSRRFRQAFTIPRILAAVTVVVLLIIMLTAQWITPHDPLAQDIENRFAPVGTPGLWLGADNFGRDIDRKSTRLNSSH